MKKLFLLVPFFTLCFNATAQQTKDSLKLRQYDLREVVVTGTRNQADVRYLPLSISTVSRSQIENRYEPSLLPLLTEQVPGLFVTSRGIIGYGLSTGAAGNMKMRGIGGSPTTDLLVLIDGHPQYMGLMGHSLADAYQSLLAEKVEVVRGPASVLYGSNAMGGVINILTRKQIHDGWYNHFRASAGSYGTAMGEFTNSVRSGKWNGVFAVSYDRTDGHRPNSDYNQYTGYAKMGYELSKQWNITADVNLTHFNSANPGTVGVPMTDNDAHITRGMTSVSLTNDYRLASGALTFFYNWGYHRINDGYKAGGTPLDYRFHSKDEMLGINWYQTLNLFEGNRTTVGFDYQHIDGNAWNLFTSGKRTDLADRRADEVAGYIDFRQMLTSILTFDAGMRVDHHSHTGTEWIPQAGLSLVLPAHAELKAMVSKGFRNPTLKEMYMFKPQNADLQPESMINYELSFSQMLMNGKLKYSANLFYIDAKNIIETVVTGGKPLNTNSGAMKNWGVETTIAYRATPYLSLSGNYSYLHTKNPITAAPRHKLYAGADYNRNAWTISTGLQWIGHLYTSTSPATTENFVLWNLRTAYRLNRWVQVFATGENLLAQHYEINAGYPMPRATVMGGLSIKF